MGVTTPVPVTTTRRAPFAFAMAILYLPVLGVTKTPLNKADTAS
jgi:hypothetical protein